MAHSFKPSSLPIFMYKAQIMESVKLHKVVIITGDTGCGKSTQVPRYLYEAGLSNTGIIACLHPRCVAAVSLANRVAEEIKTEVGVKVGYQIRFYKQFSSATRIQFMTLGCMLRQLLLTEHQDAGFNAGLVRYSAVIVDEAHERTISTDLILARMKLALASTNKNLEQLRLVVMSATLEMDEFKKYFPDARVIHIKRPESMKERVEIIYRPPQTGQKYVSAIVEMVLEIISSRAKNRGGHILVFVPSESKVLKLCRLLRYSLQHQQHSAAQQQRQGKQRFLVLPLYAAMSQEEKQRSMCLPLVRLRQRGGGTIAVVVATNVAETSVTVPGVATVVDSGWVKRASSAALGPAVWSTQRVSWAEATQRAGRAGRTPEVATGAVCYRLWHELLEWRHLDNPTGEPPKEQSITIPAGTSFLETLNLMTAFLNSMKKSVGHCPEPEMLHCDLSGLVLQLCCMGRYSDLPFLVPPPTEAFERAVLCLDHLSLVQDSTPEAASSETSSALANAPDQEAPMHRHIRLTRLGLACVRLPLDPGLAKAVAVAAPLRCVREVCIIAAMLSSPTPLKLPPVNIAPTDCTTGTSPSNTTQNHSSSCGRSNDGDLFHLLYLFLEAEINGFSRDWCDKKRVSYCGLRYSCLVLAQLEEILNSSPVPGQFWGCQYATERGVVSLIKRCLLAGFPHNVARTTASGGVCDPTTRGYRPLLTPPGEETVSATLAQDSTVNVEQTPLLFYVSIQKSLDDKRLTLRYCTPVSAELLKMFDTSKFKVKANLWKKVLVELDSSSMIASPGS